QAGARKARPRAQCGPLDSAITHKGRGIAHPALTTPSRTQPISHMGSYKLATYQSADGPRAGLVIDEMVFDAAQLTGRRPYGTMLGILNEWRTARAVLKKAAAGNGKARTKGSPLKRTKLLAPVLWPSAIYCAGA